MRKWILILFLNLITLISYGQKVIIENPYVESSYYCRYGNTKIERVACDEKETCIYITYIAKTDDEISISISSRMILLVDRKEQLGIIKWGVLNNGSFSKLELNQPYSTHSIQNFTFCLVFPRISKAAQILNIEENVNNGFYWRGIYVNHRDLDLGTSNDNRNDQRSTHIYEDANTDREDGGGNSYGYFEDTEHEDNHHSQNLYPNNDRFVVSASGSCFALNEDGYVATCYHVIEDAQRIRIRGINADFDHPLKARVFAFDRRNDLAILKIDDPNFSTLEAIPYQIKSIPSEVGEEVFTLGYPLRAVMGDEIKLTNGVISACSGYMGDATSYQFSATVQSGNSGCPVFNSDGDVIGVVNARLENIESASYAIKEQYLNALIQNQGIRLSPHRTRSMSNQPMTTKVKTIKPFVYIVEVE